jgi:quinol monooxygenase YgiN
MSPLAIFVAFTLKPGAREAFLLLVKENAATSVRNAPGCLRFDVMTPPAGDEVLLHEIYADAAADQSASSPSGRGRSRMSSPEVWTWMMPKAPSSVSSPAIGVGRRRPPVLRFRFGVAARKAMLPLADTGAPGRIESSSMTNNDQWQATLRLDGHCVAGTRRPTWPAISRTR